MVALPEGFCIDSTEVTRSQYQSWLATSPSVSGQPDHCAWNDSYTPMCDWPPGSKGDHPVVCVDWCDAYAYCKSVGKRLCGKIGGGENPFDDYRLPTSSQWYAACSSGGAKDYPYGDTYDAKACNGTDANIQDTTPVGNMSGCQSSSIEYQGVFDMSGNVREWEDSCTASMGASDDCHIRGGARSSSSYFLYCHDSVMFSRGNSEDLVGFRCCSSP